MLKRVCLLCLVPFAGALMTGCPGVIPFDADGDGVRDSEDVCPGFDDMIDADADGVPDGCDPCPADNPDDTDGDGVCDSADICPGFDDNVDGDSDGVPDGCDICPSFDDNIDTDGDGVPDGCDACPLDNPDDTDADGVCDTDDLCPGFDDNLDADGDGVPDGCEIVTIDYNWPEGVHDLGVWLEAHPAVAAALVWEGDPVDPPPAGRCGFSSTGPFCGEVMVWPWRDASAQADLFDAFVRAWLGSPSGVSDAPPNAADTSDGDEYGHQEYSPEDGRAAFMAYAANSLAVEIGNHHAERPGHMVEVGWSILDPEFGLAEDAGFHTGVTPLAVLIDSRQFFYRQPDGNLKVSLVAHGGMSVMSAPETATAFLRSALDATEIGDGVDAYHCNASSFGGVGFDCAATLPLLADTADAPTETIARTIHWFRINAIHFLGHWWYGNAEAHWQYRGYTPAIRIMTGTARTEYVSDDPESIRRPTTADTRTIPRTAGCWGTTGFMRTVLRAVNIPVVLETGGGHALPSFPTEANASPPRPSHMTHGDDPYSMLTKTSLHPTSALLVDKVLWESWFRPPPEPGDPEPEILELTNEIIEDSFLDDLPPDLDYCAGDPDCDDYEPLPEPDADAPAAGVTPANHVGRRTKDLTLSWTSWYTTNRYCDVLELQIESDPGTPVEGSEIAQRGRTAEYLLSLDCSELPQTADTAELLGVELYCREDFFGYMAEIIDAAGGCSEVRLQTTHEDAVPSLP